jgi:hypothetical protein
VAGISAQGCQSFALSTFPDLPTDSLGCVQPIDDIAWANAQETIAMLQELAQLRPDASYTFLDFYSAMRYVIDNARDFSTISTHLQ